MDKSCPNCNRVVEAESTECPYCGIVFAKWRPRQTSPPPSPAPEPASAPAPSSAPSPASTSTPVIEAPVEEERRSLVKVLVIGIAFILLISGGFIFFRGGMAKTVKMVAQKMSGKEWKYPPGTPEEMAKSMSVQQLIEAWETLPDKTSLTAQHAQYGKALGLKGPEAAQAVPVLAPFATDKDLYLRQGAMEGLAGIGPEGLPPLVQALRHGDMDDGNAVNIRWDAAMAIARMGPKAEGAVTPLLENITNPKENPNVKLEVAVALAAIGNAAVPAMSKARCYFYDQKGLSPAEVKVLREINLSLQRLGMPMEACQGADAQKIVQTSDRSMVSTSQLAQMQVPELLDALRKDPYHTREIADELVKKGARHQAVEALYELLKDRERKGTKMGVKMALEKVGAPVIYDWDRNSFLPVSEDAIGHIEWSAEMRGDTIYSTGKTYVGQDVVAGFTRAQKSPVTLPTFSKYTITVKGGNLPQPIEKTFDAMSAGENSWNNVRIASGLGAGKYRVSLFLYAQFIKEDGTGQILNNNASSLEVER